MSNQNATITLAPEVLRWARERANLTQEELASKIEVALEDIEGWEVSGEIGIHVVDELAKSTYTPTGSLYLREPPDESLPMTDFRTRKGVPANRPSPNLIEAVYLMRRRQSWMRDELMDKGYESPSGIGKYNINSNPHEVAVAMRTALNLDNSWAAKESNWHDAKKHLRDKVEAAGILVVFNGVVGNDSNRKLDPDEFQGFALFDDIAPLVFVNNSDFVAAQIFTLAHEIAHLFIGESALSIFAYFEDRGYLIEKFCNQVAAEFLVPAEELKSFWATVKSLSDPYQEIAEYFKVSTIVGARRAVDIGLDNQSAFAKVKASYKRSEEENRISNESGGNYWKNQKWRIGTQFAGAVIRATKEGRLPYREAYALTGLKNTSLDKLAIEMEIQL